MPDLITLCLSYWKIIQNNFLFLLFSLPILLPQSRVRRLGHVFVTHILSWPFTSPENVCWITLSDKRGNCNTTIAFCQIFCTWNCLSCILFLHQEIEFIILCKMIYSDAVWTFQICTCKWLIIVHVSPC